MTHNLGAALQYTEYLNAVPWLVLDLRVTSQELSNLIEYLAGSPLSAYGKLRSRDGRSVDGAIRSMSFTWK